MTNATDNLGQRSERNMGQPVLKGATAGAAVVTLPAKPPEVVVLPAATLKPFAPRLVPWGKSALVNLLPPLITVALILLFWQLAAAGPQSSLPPPTKIWEEAKDLIVEPFYWAGSQDIGLGWRILVSLQRVAIGFSLAAVVGVLLGALVGQSVWAMRGLDPVFQVLRTVPPLAWLPLSLAAFRDSQPSAIFVIFITAIWPVIINTAVGIRNIPQDYRNVAQVLRLNQIEFFYKIMVPSAAPYIFTGLRIGVGLSWLAIVAAEMLTGGVGIGFFIWDAWNSSRLSDIIVALVYIGVVGFLLDRLVALVGHVVTRGTATN
ncbi:nitrate/nitrite transport system permease protein [Bosea sp. BE271]|nr:MULTISPECIES: nitrate ABC transporter permease [Bosea]MCR4523072.1 nitrate ABC transporter permease [Bosea sp. 47.2.35]MDR6829900.1 nitrate/nitrite transport system permease protein [Bosea robiniae]MDR6896782.1 nitrate/nitrite transport system permease protein [Bosea sp. BE109]MDR7140196.1 nitrate/nitrite transport system permease protein [Bosea sp. BE168]MDR7176893.1 nitrate/nitrite transport system permease protein [Bosea sp. BE271]